MRFWSNSPCSSAMQQTKRLILQFMTSIQVNQAKQSTLTAQQIIDDLIGITHATNANN